MTEVRMSGLTAEQVRAVAAMLSRRREQIPTYNHGGTIAPHWAPIVQCEGPERWGLVTPKVPLDVAAAACEEAVRVTW